MSAKIKIRKFLPQDIDRIVEIEKSSFPKGAYSKRRLKNLSKKHPDNFIVANLGNETMGYFIAYNRANVIYLDSLAVDKKYQKLGIGKRLVNFTLCGFRKKGFKKASLEVRINNRRAISFFKGLGFKITKVIQHYYGDREDAYRMEKNL